MIHYLEILKIRKTNLCLLNCKFEVKYWRVPIFILKPPSLKESFLQSLISPNNYKYLSFRRKLVPLSEQCPVCNGRLLSSFLISSQEPLRGSLNLFFNFYFLFFFFLFLSLLLFFILLPIIYKDRSYFFIFNYSAFLFATSCLAFANFSACFFCLASSIYW